LEQGTKPLQHFKMIYNPEAIDYSKPLIKNDDGTISGTVIGCWVKELHELRRWNDERDKI